MARRRNQESEPGLIRGAYDTVTGAPGDIAHGILDEADLLLGTQGRKVKKRNPIKVVTCPRCHKRFGQMKEGQRCPHCAREKSAANPIRGGGQRTKRRKARFTTTMRVQEIRRSRLKGRGRLIRGRTRKAALQGWRNPGKIKFSEAEAKKYAGKIKGLSSIGSSAPKSSHKLSARRRTVAKRKTSKRGATKGLFRSYRAGRAVGRGIKRGARAVGRTARASAKGFWRGLLNPSGEHVPGLPAKYQRMYEDIVTAPGSKERYGSRLKEVAARTARAAYASGLNPSEFRRRNPSLFAKLFGTSKAPRVGHRKTQRGRRKVAAVGYRKTQRGTYRPTAHMEAMSRKRLRSRLKNSDTYNEFRGRDAKSTYDMMAADGTPAHTKEAGGLEEIIIGGRVVGKDKKRRIIGGRKLLFNRHKAKLLYKGQDLYIGGVKMATRSGSNPTHEVDMGPMTRIAYWADKPHLGEPTNKPYEHYFGEEGGRKPHYVVCLDGCPKVEGGDYGISPDGILN